MVLFDMTSIHLAKFKIVTQDFNFFSNQSKAFDINWAGIATINKSISQISTEGKSERIDTNIGSLAKEFERYIEGIEDSELDKKRLKSLGLEYLISDE